MANYKENYISLEEYKWYQQIGLTYDGFVTGIGYAYTRNIAIAPAHMGRHNPPRFVPPGMDHYIQGRVQYLDTSDEAIELSLKGQIKPNEKEVVEKSSSGKDNVLGNVLVNGVGSYVLDVGKEILESQHNAALAKNFDNLLPYNIDINTGSPTWVNPKYMKYKNMTTRGGTILLFGINQFGTTRDYLTDNISYKRFKINTGTNVLGAISPQYGIMFLTYDVIKHMENAWNEYMSHPNNAHQFFNKINSSFEEWRKNINGGL